MINLSELELKLNHFKKEEGLIGGAVRCIPIDNPEERRISAAISLNNFFMEFQVYPHIDEIYSEDPEIAAYMKTVEWNNPILQLCKAVFKHEIWHWKKDEFSGKIGCPTDSYHLAKNVDAAYRALKDANMLGENQSEEQKIDLADKFAGMFDDIMVNSNLGFEKQSDGLAIIYYDASKQQGLDALAEAFCRLQMGIWGKQHDKQILSPLYTKEKEKSEKIAKVLDSIVQEWGIKDKDLEKYIKRFRNPEEWSNLAYILTQHLAKLFEKGGGSGGGAGSEKEVVPQIVISLDAKSVPEQVEQQLAVESYKKKMPSPSCMSRNKFLRLVYTGLASEVKIVASSPEEGMAMPLTPLQHELFDIAQHDPQDIDFLRPVIDPESKFPKHLNFEVPVSHYTIQYLYTKGRGRIPDILFLCDDSGSMDSGGGGHIGGSKWGDKSKYHHLLLGVFGAMNWLKKTGAAPYIKYNMTLFSNTTRSSGWIHYGEIANASDVLWSPQFGGTELNFGVINPHLSVPQCVILLFTDGGIWNWNNIKTKFINATSRHKLSYIEMQDRTDTGKDLHDAGHPVYHIGKTSDLEGLVIDVTKDSYQEYVK